MNFKKALPLIVLVVLAVIALAINNYNQGGAADDATKQPKVAVKEPVESKRGLNRSPSHINYSKHARCRMGCRHIDEREVEQVLKDGKINYAKSDLKGDDCHKKYAVEGYTGDNQHVRMIFAPCNTEVTVVTVIDLGKEWQCDCE